MMNRNHQGFPIITPSLCIRVFLNFLKLISISENSNLVQKMHKSLVWDYYWKTPVLDLHQEDYLNSAYLGTSVISGLRILVAGVVLVQGL